MTSREKVLQLRKMIEEALDPLIDRDYVFLDMPYHPNVGDTLIAMAAKKFLSRSNYHCLYYSSEFTFDNRYISPNTLIIFNGGGNFGDLWQNYTDFRNMIIRKYPQNKFLILPQSVMYSDNNNLEEDVKLYSQCPDITICARDLQSYEFLKQHFYNNQILLIPDMAFYCDEKYLKKVYSTGKVLFLKRDDKEYVETSQYSIIPKKAEVHDWPTLERMEFPYWVLKQIKRINKYIINPFSQRTSRIILDFYWQNILHPYNVKSGIDFVNRYNVVYTTRLHVAIICVLLGKETYFFDNSYHKNSNLYNTWLKDIDEIQLIS
jgi:pyruvyl transferase EpsO